MPDPPSQPSMLADSPPQPSVVNSPQPAASVPDLFAQPAVLEPFVQPSITRHHDCHGPTEVIDVDQLPDPHQYTLGDDGLEEIDKQTFNKNSGNQGKKGRCHKRGGGLIASSLRDIFNSLPQDRPVNINININQNTISPVALGGAQASTTLPQMVYFLLFILLQEYFLIF